MRKITMFHDIPRFTSDGNWQCHFELSRAVPQLDRWVEEYGLDLDPDFQRIHVWEPAQQTAWLEFMLRGGKNGRVLYFNSPGWHQGNVDSFVMVDGKQRVEALRRFFDNEIPAFGSTFSEYTDSTRLLSDTIEFCVNTLSTRAEVLQWYIEMNSGGTQHTPEEIEKARMLLSAEKKAHKRKP